MLHNIIIKENESTEVAKQGRYINVVSATDEVDIVIRTTNDRTINTKIVTGMAFPVSEGFKSVSFSSRTPQQMKIWLADFPLTYAPIESKIVGSSSLVSSVVKASYGGAKQIIAERIGRKGLIMSSSKPVFIGSSQVTSNSAIKIEANQNFEIETQAAIWGYSDDITDKIEEIGDLSKGVQDDVNVFWAGANINKGFVTYLKGVDKYAVSKGNSVYLYAIGDEYRNATCSMTGRAEYFAKKSNGDLVVIQNTTLHVISDLDGTLTSIPTAVPAGVQGMAVNRNNDDIAVFKDASFEVQTGNISGALSVISHPLTGTPDDRIVNIEYTSTGKLILFSDNYCCISDDNGVSFGLAIDLPSPMSRIGKSVSVDEINGEIYYTDTFGDLRKSANNGLSFELVKSPVWGFGIDAISAIGGVVTITNLEGLSFSVDNGASWTDILFGGSYGYCGGIVISKDGIVTSHNKDTKLFGANEVIEVGGLNVVVMEEVN